MKATSRTMWMGLSGLALLGAPMPGTAQDAGAFREGRSAVVQEAPARLTLDLDDVSLRDALKTISSRSGVVLVYAASSLPLDRRVTLHLRDATVRDALREALRGTDTDVRDAPNGQLMLVKHVEREEAILPPEFAPGSISGRVTDSASRIAVIRAVVTMDGGAMHATTDDEGRYRLTDVAAGAHTLTVRRIGYAPAERLVMVPDGATIVADFPLAAVASRLNEVVTTVTGPQRRLEVGNVIAVIDADSVVRSSPVTSLSDLINARVPGAQVVLNNGMAGTAPRIRIRGLNSLTVSNDPLLVVDGIRVENSTGTLGSGYGQTAGRLNDLNPEEIESIEIVKGPSAATLYGTDAANGVIVVKTKRGRAGRTMWNVYGETGLVDQPERFQDNWYAWGHSLTTGAVQQCTLVQAGAKTCAIDSVTTFNPLMNGATTPISRGTRQQTGVQVSGGPSGISYFLSGDYEDETGYLEMPASEAARISTERGGVSVPGDQLRPNATRKVSLRANASAGIGANADFNLSSGLVSSDTRLVGDGVIGSALWGPGYHSAQDGYLSILSRPGEAFAVRNEESATHYLTSGNANWRPLSWLALRATTGLDFSSTLLDDLQRRDEGPLGTNRLGRRLQRRTNVSQYSVDAGATASGNPFPRLSNRSSLGLQYNQRRQQVTGVSGTNLPPGSETVTGAALITGEEQSLQTVVAGAYAEQTFGLDDRLFVAGALRADGGSAFGRDFRTALYPKASVSWIAVTQRTGWMNSVRLRAAYGASGVQPAPTASLPLVTVTPAFVDGVAASGARLSAIGNPDLRPERQSELETGADLELLGQRVRLEGTWYTRLSHDALINHPLSSEFGIATRQENIGSVSNRGVEGVLSATAIDNRVLTWELSASGSVNHNRLEQMGPGVAVIGVNLANQSRQGYPLVSAFARPILGYSDANGDGIIEQGEVTVGDTAVYLGPTLPPTQLTFASSISLLQGRLRIATQFDHRAGNRITNFSQINRCGLFIANCRAVNDPSAPLADQATAVAGNATQFGRTRWGYTEDGSFTRWRELSVTWTLPDRIAGRLGARSGSLSATGRNLHLFTRYSGIDPETNDAVGLAEGYGGNPTPPPARYLLMRLNLSF
ncbi:MAG TPA: SusC/RagA family TonB-linked outer membrane protein [Gemmatimonadaceae bacterium]|nr:SusC/RagA family TonB-linked outer membrane protein [Gemmatimonadaceae bacterium]